MERIEHDDISIDDIFRKISSIITYLISKSILLFILCLIGGLTGYIYAYLQSPKYNGTLSFVLSTESKSSNFSGIASQFGIDLGNGSSNDVFSGDNIISLFRSNKMIRKTLFKKPPGAKENLFNIIVHDLKWDQKWLKKPYLKSYYPFYKDSLLSPVQDSLINEVCLKIENNLLTIARPDKKLSVYMVSTTSSNEIFSCYLTRYLVDETAQFYIDTKTSIAKQNLRMLQKEADSMRYILGSSISSTASEVDRTFNLNPALQVQRSSIQKGQVNTTVLGTAYGEVVKNLELAKINLQKETPLYQIIDVPTLPLKKIRESKLIFALIGIGIALTLAIPYLLIRKKIKNLKYS